ncbi:MAG: hypothetical protein ACLPUG_06230 [Acidimicrobiales bacterium]
MANEVVVLGAGFSAAIGQYMPLTDQLGTDAIESAGLVSDPNVPRGPFTKDFSFEAWLSLLADEQPHLSDAQNATNMAIFAKMREAIVSVLASAEQAVVHYDAPDWLYKLLSAWHYLRSTVVSLNYDTLVEIGVHSHRLWGEGTDSRVTVRDVLRDLPPLPYTGTGRWGGPLAPTFRLLKLHGSLDWWWVPSDWTGATLARVDTTSVFGDPQSMSDETRRLVLPGREPFIVPPSATKSGYYRNPLTRELWRTAFEKLHAAERISLVGYSLPPADLVMSGMLVSAVRGRDVPIEVVNPCPDGPHDRLLGLGANPEHLTCIDGADCVAKFADAQCERAARRLTDELRASHLDDFGDASLLFARDNPRLGRRITGLGTPDADGVLEVFLDQGASGGDPTSPRFDKAGQPTGEVFPTLRDLVDALGTATRIVIPDANGGVTTLIGAWREYTTTGANTKWVAFAPAGKPRES